MEKVRLPLIAGMLSVFFLATYTVFDSITSTDEGALHVTFLDVGQGDATLIESPSGAQVLVDGGADSRVLSALGGVMGFFDRDIDMIVATHPDQDHIGGLIDVLIRYDVKAVLMTENMNDTPVYDAFVRAVAEEGAAVYYARAGQTYDLGSGPAGSTTLTILFPDYDPTNLESNTASIVARLMYGAGGYLLTGDSPSEIEEYLVHKLGSRLRSDVLKVGHHGSRTSSSEAFVTAVQPTYAIVSAGKDNSYGHPHSEVIDRLILHGSTQKNTADLGSIFLESDGVSLWFR